MYIFYELVDRTQNEHLGRVLNTPLIIYHYVDEYRFTLSALQSNYHSQVYQN